MEPVGKEEPIKSFAVVECKPSLWRRIGWKLSEAKWYLYRKYLALLMFLLRKAVGESNMIFHARDEMKRAGLFDKDSDYSGMLADSVMNMMYVFAMEGHSGASAHSAINLFSKLAKFETLTPITSDPSEWNDVSVSYGGEPQWQNRRNSKCFSRDGGKTWYNYEDCLNIYKHPDGATFSCGSLLTEEEAEGAILIRAAKCDTCMVKEKCERKGKNNG
jgi:hypothetical protein